jgi:hypothetical protein
MREAASRRMGACPLPFARGDLVDERVRAVVAIGQQHADAEGKRYAHRRRSPTTNPSGAAVPKKSVGLDAASGVSVKA